MSFAQPVKLRAGLSRTLLVVYLAIFCFPLLAVWLAGIPWFIQLLLSIIVLVVGMATAKRLQKQADWVLVLRSDGQLDLYLDSELAARRSVELRAGSWSNQLFAGINITLAGQKLTVLIDRWCNDAESYRRMRVWVNLKNPPGRAGG